MVINKINLNKELKTILVVEDSVFMNKIIKTFLQKENYNVLFAENVFDALGLLEVLTPDVILLDIMMPVNSGIISILICEGDKSLWQK